MTHTHRSWGLGMNRLRTLPRTAAFALAMLGACTAPRIARAQDHEAPAAAAGPHDEPGAIDESIAHHAAPHVANWWTLGEAVKETPALGFLMITFLVFVAIIVVSARKPLTTYLETRSKDVQKAIDEARAAKEDAERRARAAEARYAALEQETARLKSDFETQGKAELERLVQVGKDAAARIAKDTEDTLAAETERSRSILRREAARLALEIAEQRIQRALTPDDDVRLQKSLVQDLGAA